MDSFYPHFADNKQFILLACDMGYSVIDKYIEYHHDRVILMGISEQATIGIAAGLSLEGFVPVIYSQIPFITMRCFEQLRYDINEHVLSVKIIGIGACNYFHKLGRSHCIDDDDIKLMSILKNFLILEPNEDTLQNDIKSFVSSNCPVYVRTI